MSDLQIAVTTVVDTNFGDHGARIQKAHAYIPGETVEDLVRRVFPNVPPGPFTRHNFADEVVLRVVVDHDGHDPENDKLAPF